MTKKLKITVIILSAIIALIIAAFVTLLILSSGVKLDETKLKPAVNAVNVYDSDGNVIKKSDEYVSIEAVPQKLKDAFVSLEDKRFYKHNGIDVTRIVSALWTDIKSGSFKEGGSTITQQLIKNTHLDGDKNFRRKLREARLALELEKKYSKDEILEMYLNVIYLGGGVYGVKNGAMKFFGKECADLSLAQCASIAGITKNPSKYSPLKNLENNKNRAKTVLNLMLEQEKITLDEYTAAASELDGLALTEEKTFNRDVSARYVSNAYAQASDILGMEVSEIKEKNYKIYTYYDEIAQRGLFDTANAEALNVQTANGADARKLAIICDNTTRGITAYYSDDTTPLFYMRRQVGSVIKPFYSYAPAIEENIIYTTSLLDDVKSDFDGYSPSNYADVYRGKITAKKALSFSSNVCAVQLAYLTGEEKCFGYARNFGLNLEEKDKNLSSALGGLTYGLSPANLATAYASLACGGLSKDVSFVREIIDAQGKTVFRHSDAEERRAISEQTAFLIDDMLKNTVSEGTANKLSVLPFPVYAKTGTVSHNDKNFNTEAWNAAFTSRHTTVCLYTAPSDDFLPKTVTGGSYPTLLAKNVLEKLYAIDDTPAEIPMPQGIIKADLSASALQNGILKRTDEAIDSFDVTTEYFKSDFAPDEIYLPTDVPRVSGWKIERINGIDKLEFETKGGFGYKIIRESFFGGETVLFDTSCDNDGKTVFEAPAEALAIYRYVIRPYKQLKNKQLFGIDEISRIISIFG